MLDDRKVSILRAVVEEYIATAQPVGSQHIASSSDLGVSAATVRNDMASLEREGYLIQPHTSAGRIPTDKGYRTFVDKLSSPRSLDPLKSQLVSQFFATAHGELERILHDTTTLLSGLTDYAAVVVAPQVGSTATIRSVQIVSLTSTVGLVVVVLSNGVVEKSAIDIPVDISNEKLNIASTKMSSFLQDLTLTQAKNVNFQPVFSLGDNEITEVVLKAKEAIAKMKYSSTSEVFVGGTSRMAGAFNAVETVRSILSFLEEQIVLVGLLRNVVNSGLSVAIGTEHGVVPLAQCSVVVAPYSSEGEQVGTIGVLGPTRMDYAQALAAVGVVAKRLSCRLSEG